MHYGELKNCDIANGLGIRVSLFVSGCRNCCKDCFNQMTWNFLYGKEFTKQTLEQIIEMMKPDYIDVLVDGPFMVEKKNLMLKFRGSTNQRVIDLNKTRTEKQIVLYLE